MFEARNFGAKDAAMATYQRRGPKSRGVDNCTRKSCGDVSAKVCGYGNFHRALESKRGGYAYGIARGRP